LTPDQGVALLRKKGVHGPEQRIARLAESWNGHALSLSLIAGDVSERFGGDLSALDELPSPLAETPQYARIHFLLKNYEQKLTYAERAFLVIAGVMGRTLEKRHFKRVFKARHEGFNLNLALSEMEDDDFEDLVARLVRLRILQADPFLEKYSLQPLISTYFYTTLSQVDRRNIHLLLAGFWESEAQAAWNVANELEEILGQPVMALSGLYIGDLRDSAMVRLGEDSLPIDWRVSLIEAVHHFSSAWAFDEAYHYYYHALHQGEWALVKQQGAFGTDLQILKGFFPEGDFEKEPLLDNPGNRAVLINQVGYDLMQLGRPLEAEHFFNRAVRMDRELDHPGNAFNTLLNVFQALIQAGDLKAAQGAASELETLRPLIHDKEIDPRFYSIAAISSQAWICHLRGETARAAGMFEQATRLQAEREEEGAPYLYAVAGQYYVSHLIDVGELDRADTLASYNLELSRMGGWGLQYPAFKRFLGDIARHREDFVSARNHYDEALNCYRSMRLQYELGYALLGSGLLALAEDDLNPAQEQLQDALALCRESGFLLLEAEVVLALARLTLRGGNQRNAQELAGQALKIARATGYKIGRGDLAGGAIDR
jgi:tetratricopeptide (TPR) repeat protein